MFHLRGCPRGRPRTDCPNQMPRPQFILARVLDSPLSQRRAAPPDRPVVGGLVRASIVFLPLLLSLLGLSLFKRLDHDEHQFIASAALLARRGLLPYRDYPYFHMPHMVF